MAQRQQVDVQVDTRAAASVVHGLLRDGASWPRWTSIDSFQRERAGDREPGLPLRDYRADVDLAPPAEGTRISWHIEFTPQVPGIGWLCQWGIGRFIDQSARGLAAYAHNTASSGY